MGIVTNAYGLQTDEDAELWLRPLVESGVSHIDFSNDTFHYGDQPENPAAIAADTAARLGISVSSICIEPPKVIEQPPGTTDKGRPVVGGGAKFRGRAVEKLAKNLPRRPWQELCECPYENLEAPSRVHVDAYGNVHICQGISLGNMWETPLSSLISNYRADSHPICGPLVHGGPAALANALGVPLSKHDAGYIDECHLCFMVRKRAIDTFPDQLAPRQVYGLDEE